MQFVTQPEPKPELEISAASESENPPTKVLNHELQKMEKRFLSLYNNFKTEVQYVRLNLQEECSKFDLKEGVLTLKKWESDLKSQYNDLSKMTTPCKDLKRKMSSCVSVTSELVSLLMCSAEAGATEFVPERALKEKVVNMEKQKDSEDVEAQYKAYAEEKEMLLRNNGPIHVSHQVKEIAKVSESMEVDRVISKHVPEPAPPSRVTDEEFSLCAVETTSSELSAPTAEVESEGDAEATNPGSSIGEDQPSLRGPDQTDGGEQSKIPVAAAALARKPKGSRSPQCSLKAKTKTRERWRMGRLKLRLLEIGKRRKTRCRIRKRRNGRRKVKMKVQGGRKVKLKVQGGRVTQEGKV